MALQGGDLEIPSHWDILGARFGAQPNRSTASRRARDRIAPAAERA
jgi:hypothetical protein